MLWIYTWHWLWLATDHYQFNIHQNSIVRHSVWLQYSYLVCFCGGFSGVLFFVFSISLSLVKNWGNLTWVRHSSCKSSTTHSHQCVQYFGVSEQWYSCRCCGFLTCPDDACNCTRRLYRHRKSLHLKVTQGENPTVLAQGNQTHISYIIAPGFSLFQSDRLPTESSRS